MENKHFTLILVSLILVSTRCDDPDFDTNFLVLEDRIGAWVNGERQDTLFVENDTSLIQNRKGRSGPTRYRYRIENETLYLRLHEDSVETSTKILSVANREVTLRSFYFGHEGTDNNGTFIKQDN